MDILIKSVASGIVTAIILLIARYSTPKLAGAIGGLPIVFAVSYALLFLSNKGIAKDFLVGGIYGAIAAIFFSLVLIGLNVHFSENYWLNFAIAYVLCFLLAPSMVYLTAK